jgi:ABC-type sugar transport system permease subunit
LAVALVVPELVAIWMSLTNAAPGEPTRYVGLRNYNALFRDPQFWHSVEITAVYVVVVVVLDIMFATAISVLLARNFRRTKLWIALILVPLAVSPATLGPMWKYLFDQNGGMINYALSLIGLRPVPWFSEPAPAFATVVIAYLWHTIPAAFILIYPATIAVPEEYYEAARIDGAAGRSIFWRITLPIISPAIRVATIFSIIWTSATFGEIYVLTQGGPLRSTETLSIFLYQTGFQDFAWGKGAAVGCLMLLFTLFIALPQIRLLGRDVAVAREG